MINTQRNAKFLEAMQWSGAPLRAKLATYAAINGLEIKEDLNPGELLKNRKFGEWLREAKTLLSVEDQEYLASVPLVISDAQIKTRQIEGRFYQTINAAATHIKDAEGHLTGMMITLYRTNILAAGSQQKYTREQFVDWIKRLLQHEIGHARDQRSDEQMAKESNY